MSPILELFISAIAKVFLIMLDLNKGNLYQGERVVYIMDITNKQRFIYLHLEGETLTLSGAPPAIVPDLFAEAED